MVTDSFELFSELDYNYTSVITADLVYVIFDMGKMFFEHMGGVKVYYCGSCLLNLTNQESLLSRHFHGETGRAFLFKKVSKFYKT